MSVHLLKEMYSDHFLSTQIGLEAITASSLFEGFVHLGLWRFGYIFLQILLCLISF